jgi:hypothetical protein
MQINLPALITFIDKIQSVLFLPGRCQRNAQWISSSPLTETVMYYVGYNRALVTVSHSGPPTVQ